MKKRGCKRPSSGQRWEREFFGGERVEVSSFDNPPDYQPFQQAMFDVRRKWQGAEATLTEMPMSRRSSGPTLRKKPPVGMSRDLWREVRKNLPRHTSRTRHGLPNERLYLYVSIGTALDWWHGVDAFFWWRGTYVTFDLSGIMKVAGKGSRPLKADFICVPFMAFETTASSLGKSIADKLVERRRGLDRLAEELKRLERREEKTFRNRIPVPRDWKSS